MKKFVFLMKILVLISLFIGCSAAFAADTDDFAAVKERYREYYLTVDGYSNTIELAKKYIASQNDDGSWSDIVYDDENNKTQTAYDHLRRLVIIVNGATAEGTTVDKDAAIAAVEKGLEAWKQRIPLTMQENGYLSSTKRWWQDTIGQQLHFMIPLVATGYDFISERSMEIAMSYFLDDIDMHNYPGFLTGANLVWYQNQGIVRSLFSDNIESLRATFKRMTDAVYVSKNALDEGIQADRSFHQHGRQHYYGYESNYFLNIMINSKLLRGTSLENKEIYPLLAEMVLEGDRWIYHGGEKSELVMGRNISSKYSAPAGETPYTRALGFLAELYPECAENVNAFRESIINNDKTNAVMTGNKHFWCSDVMSHKRSGWSALLKTVSERTISTESNVTQNSFGAYVGVGTLFLTTSGNSQNPNRVCFDWGHLPGVTSPSEVQRITQSGTFITQESDFVGGVSDGEYGASAMKLYIWNTMANKSYFFFDDCYVAMGSGILSARDDICTTIDQRGLDGKIYINGTEAAEGKYSAENVTSIYADKIGYVFPNSETLTVQCGDVNSSWASIVDGADETSISQKMFTVWKNHSRTAKNDSYCYIVYPLVTQEELSAKVSVPSVSVVENSKNIHAVLSSDKKLGYAVFFKSGVCRFNDDLSVEVDKPCIVMLKYSGDTWNVSVSDPTTKLKKINVKLTTGGKETAKDYDMPQNNLTDGEMGGKTVMKEF